MVATSKGAERDEPTDPDAVAFLQSRAEGFKRGLGCRIRIHSYRHGGHPGSKRLI